MNDLNLRVSGGVGEKVKKPAAPLSLSYLNNEMPGIPSDFFSNFKNCNSADNQLKLLKQFLTCHKDVCEQDTIKFLVLLFWHADGKHPVKGFLKKHITDSRILNQPFTETLTLVIAAEIKDPTESYIDCIGTITRLDAGTDKFPPGAAAVSALEVDVASYYVRCLETCIKNLGLPERNVGSEVKSESLPPTEINKIYDLVHLTLRLLLYMIQKVTDENRGKLSSMFSRIRSIVAELMGSNEVPMDTKSVSGIISLTMHLFVNGTGSWIELLEEDRRHLPGTVNLSIYSAVATVVPPAELVATQLYGQPAVLDLTDKILALGDTYSSESSHTLAVGRSLLAVSRALSAGAGAGLAARLARWCGGHLDHHVDSVRHHAAQLVARVVAAADTLLGQGDPSVMEHLFTYLSTLDSARKSFYVTLTALAETLGAALLDRRPGAIRDGILGLRTQAVQACATTFLETLLKQHMKRSDPETVYRQWVCVVLAAVKRESDPTVLSILERILAKAVLWDSGVLDYILPEQRALSSYEGSDLKCILLVLGVVRKSGVAYKGLTFQDLRHTAYDADDEVRILSLSLVAETPRSTEPLAAAELAFVLHFLQYNMNAQAPSFRQLVLANMKKILKRLEDSYKVLKRKEDHTEMASYQQFLSGLRALCVDSLAAGAAASYGRRCSALQMLSWLESLQLADWQSTWTEEEAEILFNLLEDSYENNKALALEVLKNCPVELIRPVHSPSYVADAIAQASSVRPTECVAASYKLLLLLSLPMDLEVHYENRDVPSPACFGLLTRILRALQQQVSRARHISRAARDAPMYGLVHCLARLLGVLDTGAIAGDGRWSALIAEVISACEAVNSRVEGVVTAVSPEGFLPDSDPDCGGRAVTSQMVLLCAWRSVKETSLLLGTLVSRLQLEGESPAWSVGAAQVEHVGEVLTSLLGSVKHRGAFEQAYVGLTLLLARLWKCKSSLHQLPLQWFSAIERSLLLPAAASAEYCATRRGAGLPFMIQALVTTELAAESSAPRGRLLRRALELCLRAARPPPPPPHTPAPPTPPPPATALPPPPPPAPSAPADIARAHLVLRALHRHTVPPAEYTAQALMVAVRGFEADTWTVRNSSTLLFSALVVRVFGVARAGGHRLSPRNTMTGRIFFLRYPELYDFLLDQLKCVSPESQLRPSLFPTLLLLARLYPSALEGTVSNLKLARFLPPVVALAGARDASTRRRAARAAAPGVPPTGYLAHMQSLLVTLGDPAIKRNLCHGLLCQLTVLLELRPSVPLDGQSASGLQAALRGTFWIPAQTCFLVADEWLKLINLVLLRFPNLLDDDLPTISAQLETVLFSPAPTVTSGREVFLSNAAYLAFIIGTSPGLVIKCLQHKDYEVNLSALNYLLVLHGYNEDSCPFLEHLSKISNDEMLKMLEGENYIRTLCKVTENGYLESKQKALKVLALTENTQREIVKLKLGNNVELTDEIVIKELIDSIRNGHANLSSVYLESLLRLVSNPVLEIVRVLYESSGAGNDEGTREIVVAYLERHLRMLMEAAPSGDEAEMFEWWATLTATAAILLEDDAPAVRQRAAGAVLDATRGSEPRPLATASRAARQWRRAAAAHRAAPALLITLAALDFCAHVDSPDELGEEQRVFDQNETHNVYLEEYIWSKECALELKRIHRQTNNTQTIEEYIQSIVCNTTYKGTIEKLCIDNAIEYVTGRIQTNNPKINVFLKILHE